MCGIVSVCSTPDSLHPPRLLCAPESDLNRLFQRGPALVPSSADKIQQPVSSGWEESVRCLFPSSLCAGAPVRGSGQWRVSSMEGHSPSQAVQSCSSSSSQSSPLLLEFFPFLHQPRGVNSSPASPALGDFTTRVGFSQPCPHLCGSLTVLS